MIRRRSFYFLQGNASWLFRRLGAALVDRGHRVRRMNFCGGDRHFWGDWNAADWRVDLSELGAFLEDDFQRRGVDAIVLFGDCRPIHRRAIAAARRLGIDIFVFEEGYLRPHWLTLERDGVNGYSQLPDDPAWYRAAARTLPRPPKAEPVGPGLARRILYDFEWQALNYVRYMRYPRYATHRPYPIWAEYATWAMRLAKLPWRRRQARAHLAQALRGGRPFFLFPLQLDSDYQIRVHSPFTHLSDAIAATINDFAAHAPTNTLLIVKNHPLDNGWTDHRKLVWRHARARDVADRVLFLEGGPLDVLIDRARGVVTVNSTVGLTALERGRPVICLGKAIHDVPGLTSQGSLAEFWHGGEPPQADLLDAFRTVLLHCCLVGGNFYTDRGVASAVAGSIPRLETPITLLADAPARQNDRTRRLAGLA